MWLTWQMILIWQPLNNQTHFKITQAIMSCNSLLTYLLTQQQNMLMTCHMISMDLNYTKLNVPQKNGFRKARIWGTSKCIHQEGRISQGPGKLEGASEICIAPLMTAPLTCPQKENRTLQTFRMWAGTRFASAVEMYPVDNGVVYVKWLTIAGSLRASQFIT